MHQYTVVLQRPEYIAGYIADPHYGQPTYVAHVEAEDPKRALGVARNVVCREDRNDQPRDYTLCVMFEGHHNSVSDR